MDEPIKILAFQDLSALHGIRFSRQHLHRLEAQKKFPRRVPVGEHHIGWVQSEIVAYLKAKMAARPS